MDVPAEQVSRELHFFKHTLESTSAIKQLLLTEMWTKENQ